MPGVVEPGADGADPAVHHVRGCDHVAARGGQRERLLGQGLERLVVEDHAVAQQAVLAVDRVGVERHVADDADARYLAPDRTDGAADEIVLVPGLGRVLALPLRLGDREQGHGRDAELAATLHLAHQQVDRKTLDPRHRRHGLALRLAVQHEEGLDQVGGPEPALGHQASHPALAPEPARPAAGEWRLRSGVGQGGSPVTGQ
jgi:hypothetical protein